MGYKKEITCEITQHLAVLEKRDDGWSLELNLVQWNKGPVKYDIRPWNADHSRCNKGITLEENAAKKLAEYFQAHPVVVKNEE